MPNQPRLIRVSRKSLGGQHCLRSVLGNILLSWIQLGPSVHDHTAKTTDEQKLLPRKQFLNKGLPSTLAFLIRKSYAAQVSGSDAAENTFVALGATNLCPSHRRRFGKVVENNTYGDQWKGTWPDGQTSLYNPEKPVRFPSESQSWPVKQGVHPNSFGLHCQPRDNSMVQQASSFKQSVESALAQTMSL